MKRILFFLLTIVLLTGCNKTKNKLLFSGQIYSPNEDKNLANITVELQAQIIETGTYNSNFQLLQKVTTDGEGKYNITNDNVRASVFKLIAYANDYIRTESEINSDLVTVGKTYNHNFNLYSKAYLMIYVHNTAPADSTDEITISVIHSSPNCSVCCDISNAVFTGVINDTLNCLVYGNQTVKVDYTVNTSSNFHHYSHNVYCPAFETETFSINY